VKYIIFLKLKSQESVLRYV